MQHFSPILYIERTSTESNVIELGERRSVMSELYRQNVGGRNNKHKH